MFAHLFPFSTLHSHHQSYARGMLGASPTKCQGLGALDSSRRLGAFESHLDETPSHRGATSYSTTQGIEDCQLSLVTLESIFYFPNETQLFMLPAGQHLSLAAPISAFSFSDKTPFTLPVALPCLSETRLLHFSHWDTNWVSLTRFLTFLVNVVFSPLSIKADGLPWLPPVLSSPSDTRVFSICLPYILFDIYYARGMFGASPTKCQGLGALGSSQRLGAFKSHLGMDIP
ncbi:hypothetical protein F5J12DRAFT_787572 [Pisolithus orientalis]|uniref:uncharacterized protein n=1 Tax=Pisolithus orientalis TaxID=936130 RepID=UPI002224452F|nr:uncharacterized protein F5J12DRAFT_787572 [Pisolithus orientalis]KAI5984390.1 hypothetical protein F5J12DRAFT_787572 [Pisolithus orientalis]